VSIYDLKRPQKGDPISAREQRKLVDAVRPVLGAPGTMRDGLGYYGRRTSSVGATGVFIRAKITGATVADTPAKNRWKYSWREVEKTVVGYGTAGTGPWTVLSGGREGTSNAYNYVEAANDATGQQGNGVDVANLLGTFALKAVPNDVIVLLEEINFRVTGTLYTEYWFSYENGVDGECA
jgi:hypothetical protein